MWLFCFLKQLWFFLTLSTFPDFPSSQEILKARVDLSHAIYLLVFDCKEHYFTRQTSIQVSLAINHTILLENLVASTLKLLFLIFEIRMLIFRIFHGTDKFLMTLYLEFWYLSPGKYRGGASSKGSGESKIFWANLASTTVTHFPKIV